MNPVQRAYLELHFAVLLFGFTAILGDLIQLSAMVLVWWRVLLTSASLLFVVRVAKLFRELPRKTILQFMGIGTIVGLHWIAFYGAIKLANASIAVVCMATTSFFTALLEPLLTKQRIKGYELILGILVIPGMALIVNSTKASMISGIWVGLISAFLASLFATLNKKMVGKSDELSITFLELGASWVFISFLLPFLIIFSDTPVTIMPSTNDWIYLLVLALFCTTLSYVLALRSLRHLSAFASNLTINLEPIYGIVLAWVILNEHEELTDNFYIGVVVILIAVFSYPLLKKKFNR